MEAGFFKTPFSEERITNREKNTKTLPLQSQRGKCSSRSSHRFFVRRARLQNFPVQSA